MPGGLPLNSLARFTVGLASIVLWLEWGVIQGYNSGRHDRKEQMIMTHPLPEGEDLRRAVRWISSGLQDDPHEPLFRLVEQAVFKFDLSPKDGEFLQSFFKGGAPKDEDSQKG